MTATTEERVLRKPSSASLAAGPRDAFQVTVLSNDAGLLTKTYAIVDGTLSKKTQAFLSSGTARTEQCAGLGEFASLLDRLRANEAVAYGITGRPASPVVTKDEQHLHPGAIARSRDFFAFAKGPAILFLDHDPDHVHQAIDGPDELRACMLEACPELISAPAMWRTSSSSNIVRIDTGEAVTGLAGQRLYLPLIDGSDIPRAGKALYERLWLAGRGCFIVSKDGSLLDRNVIDGSVWQPERLDFAAGAKCSPPLKRQAAPHRIWGDPHALFDSRLIADLTMSERDAVAAARATARREVAEEAAAVRASYIETKAQGLAQRRALPLERARELIRRAVEEHLLFGDFELMPERGEPVTVGQVLDDPAKWHNARFADPMEPDYRGDRRVAWVNLRSGGRPYLFSHAHGGRRFQMLRQPKTLKVQAGEMPRLVDETLSIVREHAEVFDFGTRSMVRLGGEDAAPVLAAVDHDWLRDYLGRRVCFERFDGRSKAWKPVDTPIDLARFILAKSGQRGLPNLVAIITAPTLRIDGSVLDVPGFDTASGLLYAANEPAPLQVPASPTTDQVVEAFEELWQPFAQFPFTDATARGVMLAALLTATVRRALPTAPGFAFDAPAAGSGKTLLASCVAALAGHRPVVMPVPREDDEARKGLFAALLNGAGIVLWDNLIRPLEGAALNAFLTAEQFGDRVLGASRTEAPVNRALFLVTGNNLRIVGDTARRVLVARLDPRVEVPYLRQFAFDPLTWVHDRRQRLVRAALTVLRGYQASGIALASGRMASFEAWDDLVRQCVAWVGELPISVSIDDPAKSALASASEDPARAALGAVLVAWRDAFGQRHVGAKEAWSRAFDDIDDSPALRNAIEVVADGDRQFRVANLGRWLARHRGEVVNRLRFADSLDSHHKVKLWGVE